MNKIVDVAVFSDGITESNTHSLTVSRTGIEQSTIGEEEVLKNKPHGLRGWNIYSVKKFLERVPVIQHVSSFVLRLKRELMHEVPKILKDRQAKRMKCRSEERSVRKK